MLSFNDEFKTVLGRGAVLMLIGSESTKQPSCIALTVTWLPVIKFIV